MPVRPSDWGVVHSMLFPDVFSGLLAANHVYPPPIWLPCPLFPCMQLCADPAGEVPVHVWAQAGGTQAGGGVLLRYSRVPLRPVRILGPAERMGHRVRVQVRPSVLLTAPLYCLPRLVLRCTHCVVVGVDHLLQAQAHHAHGRGSPRLHQGEQVDLARVHEWSDIVMNLSGASAVHLLCATPSTLPPVAVWFSPSVPAAPLRPHLCATADTGGRSTPPSSFGRRTPSTAGSGWSRACPQTWPRCVLAWTLCMVAYMWGHLLGSVSLCVSTLGWPAGVLVWRVSWWHRTSCGGLLFCAYLLTFLVSYLLFRCACMCFCPIESCPVPGAGPGGASTPS
jgi:hypothetical protein